MPYTPDATVGTEPVDGQKASTMALEFRTLKTYIQSVLIPLIGGKIGTGGGTSLGAIIVAPTAPLSTPAFSARTSASTDSAGLQLGPTDGSRLFTLGYLGSTSGPAYGAVAGDTVINQLTNNLVFSTADVKRAWLDQAGVFHFVSPIAGNITGNAATATNATFASTASWTGISGRPTALSAFTNDTNYLTSVTWTSVAGRPTNLSQFVNDLAGSGIISFQGRGASAATLLSSDITGVLGFTPYANTNPAGYQNSSGSVAYAGVAGSIPWSGVSSIPSSSNAFGNRTISTSAPSGGSDGDIWYQV